MRIGYIIQGGTQEFDIESGSLVILVGTQDVYLQEYLVQTLLDITEHEEERKPLREVMQYVQITYEDLSS